jgi:hypothetical protein
MEDVDKSHTAQVNRKVAIQLAIEEVAAYKQSTWYAGSTDDLIKSAAAILNYLEKAEVPN